MKTLFNDEDGFTAKDFVVLATTMIYVAILLPIVYAILQFPDKYDKEILEFLLTLIKFASTAYGVIVTFYFGGNAINYRNKIKNEGVVK